MLSTYFPEMHCVAFHQKKIGIIFIMFLVFTLQMENMRQYGGLSEIHGAHEEISISPLMTFIGRRIGQVYTKIKQPNYY